MSLQFSEATGPIIGAVVLFTVASLVPLLKGSDSKGVGPFTPQVSSSYFCPVCFCYFTDVRHTCMLLTLRTCELMQSTGMNYFLPQPIIHIVAYTFIAFIASLTSTMLHWKKNYEVFLPSMPFALLK